MSIPHDLPLAFVVGWYEGGHKQRPLRDLRTNGVVYPLETNVSKQSRIATEDRIIEFCDARHTWKSLAK
jgi:hypothetical protein